VRRWPAILPLPLASLLALLLAPLLAGCSSAPSAAAPSASPRAGAGSSPSPDSASSGERLFAVLEPGGDFAQMRNDVVALVRTNGTAKARAVFKRRQLPRLRAALPVPQPEARVAAGKVYFADGTGTIRSLSPAGAVSEVTRFPLSDPQQTLSFSVSPDGSRLMGAVLQFPPFSSSLTPTPLPAASAGSFTLRLYSASPGGAAAPVLEKSWPESTDVPRDVLAMVGWSASAPLATVDTDLAIQQRTEGRQMFGHVAEIDRVGKPGLTVGGSDCRPWTVLPDETALCDDGGYQNVSVRSRGGDVLFQLPDPGSDQYLNLSLSPDASRVAYQTLTGRSFVLQHDRNPVVLASGFQPQGWLDSSTLVGLTGQGSGDVALVRLTSPARAIDLGFKGFFVGVVQGG
jgi:hypothetical protein